MTSSRAATRNGQTGQLPLPEIFANMMALRDFTRKVNSRDCVTSTLTTSQDNFCIRFLFAVLYRIKQLNNQCTMHHASKNFQHRSGENL